MTVKILVGDALTRLRDLPDKSVHCCITSPPYWGLRSYTGEAGMIGMENTIEEHLVNLVAVCGEVWRVLRNDGTFWLNYGDAYAANQKGTGGMTEKQSTNLGSFVPGGVKLDHGLKSKDLMMMPARVALALQADGLVATVGDNLGNKPNPMPESVTDRPTSCA